MFCLDDDAQGHALDVVWELELEKSILDRAIGWCLRHQEVEPNRENATLEELRVAMEAAPDRRLPTECGIEGDPRARQPLERPDAEHESAVFFNPFAQQLVRSGHGTSAAVRQQRKNRSFPAGQ